MHAKLNVGLDQRGEDRRYWDSGWGKSGMLVERWRGNIPCFGKE